MEIFYLIDFYSISEENEENSKKDDGKSSKPKKPVFSAPKAFSAPKPKAKSPLSNITEMQQALQDEPSSQNSEKKVIVKNIEGKIIGEVEAIAPDVDIKNEIEQGDDMFLDIGVEAVSTSQTKPGKLTTSSQVSADMDFQEE